MKANQAPNHAVAIPIAWETEPPPTITSVVRMAGPTSSRAAVRPYVRPTAATARPTATASRANVTDRLAARPKTPSIGRVIVVYPCQ